MGPNLPDVAFGPKMVAFDNTVILVGGTQGFFFYDHFISDCI